nr:UvrD-helicase domain-containing protein [Solirubrobacterales bacterium]
MTHFTAEQRAAIEQRDGPLLLSANAGSGKTSVLVERLVAAVLEDGIPPAQLLAITFTEKAAGELRSRVRARLAELGERVAAREIERAQISTIHGFCSGVLRAHAVAAGLDPAFTVLPGSATRELRARAFDDALAELLSEPADGALDLVAAWGPDRLRDAVEEVHEALRSQGQTEPRLPPCRPPRTVQEALAGLRAPTDLFTEELRGGRAGVKTVDAAREALSACHELLAAPGTPAREALDALRIARGAKELKTDACGAWVAAVEALGTALDDEEAAADHALLDTLLGAFARAYAAGKRALSGVDYDDLQLLVRDLLRDRPEVRAGYADRFSRVMVDEFQDTNALQLELIGFLDTGRTFLVGDELQSIYGFRHADVTLFRRQRAAHHARGEAAVLATNWRSHPELLETINGAWGEVVHAGYVPLVAGRTAEEETAAPRTELLLTSTAWDAPGLDARLADELGAGMPSGVKASKLAEARAVARRVRTLVDAGECREEEAVVLVRAASDLHVFARALEREGFATLAGGGRGYWLRQPVQDLTSYLGALINPRDERALFGTLASPLCGLSSDGLAHVAAAAREHGDAWRAVRSVALARRLGGADAAALEAFLIRFGLERTTAARYGLDELIERAVVRSGYDLHVLRLPGGRRRLANVHKLERLAAAYEEDHGRDVRGFIDHAQAEAEADVREADAPVELSGAPAIRLMTIHAAKGLEFGVV